MAEFESWLTEKLTALGTDASVFSPYIGKQLASLGTDANVFSPYIETFGTVHFK